MTSDDPSTPEFHDEAQGGAPVDATAEGPHTAGITAATRRTVLERDRWRCRACGTDDTDVLTLHHVVYRSQGGGHQADNLVTLCFACHRKVHAKTLLVTRIGRQWFFANSAHWRTQMVLRDRPRR